jgi:cytochrome c-type biogenesis protein CcmH/NrfG
MWALAALYYRAGIAQDPTQIAGYLNLTTAYLHLDEQALAQAAFKQARSLEPDHPRVVELAKLVEIGAP